MEPGFYIFLLSVAFQFCAAYPSAPEGQPPAPTQLPAMSNAAIICKQINDFWAPARAGQPVKP